MLLTELKGRVKNYSTKYKRTCQNYFKYVSTLKTYIMRDNDVIF